MGAAAVPLLIGGAALSAVGSIQQGYAGAAAAKYNAQVAQQNAQLATQNAQWTGAEGEQQYGVQGLKTQATAGAQKAGEAGNNVDVNSGSAVAVRQGTAEAGQLSSMNIRSNAARQAYGYETQSTQYTGQAALDKSQAQSDITAGYLGAGADVLKGAGQAELYSSVGANSDGVLATTPTTDSAAYNSSIGTAFPD